MKKTAGFTLIELMVAVAVMALLAMLSWRGLDGMTRVQSQTQNQTDGVLALQAGLSQWQTDLDAMVELPQVPGVTTLDYDGQVLRLTRRYMEQKSTSQATDGTSGNIAESIRVVAWSQRQLNGKSQWVRWQSAATGNRAELLSAWLQAKQWAQNSELSDKKQDVPIAAIDKWQIYYFRNNTWSNAQSSADTDALIPGTKTATLPEGVRLVLTLSADQALVGNITRDWLSPTL